MAAFTDNGDIAVRPWDHYVPIRMDLMDFDEKIEWARNNDEEMARIASRGQ